VPIGKDGRGVPVLPSPEFIKQWEDLFKRVGQFEALNNIELEALSDTRNETLTYLALAPDRRPQSRLSAAGIVWRYRSLSADASLVVGDFADVDASGAAVTVTLPSAAASKGRIVGVSKVDSSANAVTLSGDINGQSSIKMTRQYTALILVSTGSEWRII
jgi:hypothetical protein